MFVKLAARPVVVHSAPVLNESRLIALAVTAGLAACAPARVAGPSPAPAGDEPAVAMAPAGGDADADTTIADEALEARLVEMARTTRGPRASMRPIKPLGVSWSSDPREGSPLGIVLHDRPSGRAPVGVEGRLAGHAVTFGRLRGQWFGIAALPIGTSGPQVLTLRLHFEAESDYEQTIELDVRPTRFASTNLRVDSRFSSPPADVLERIREERVFVRGLLETVTPEWLLDAPFEPPRPVDVTSPFGQARMFNGELRSRHTGLDLRGRTGAPVKAAGRGRVAYAGNLYFAGNAVYVDHGLGVYTGYFHLSRILVAIGDEVSPGDLIGEVGATGRVTAAHLHWYLSVGGQSLDAGGLLDLQLPDRER